VAAGLSAATAKVTITSSDFKSNSARGAGGAVFVDSSAVPKTESAAAVSIRDSNFESNEAKMGGGLGRALPRLATGGGGWGVG
jgi:predicted outer membrane repeat protein